MNQENRRSFVKKSLATSVSISFTGLIRAHGEETTQIINTTASGFETTTWNPNESTVETTTPEETSTWNPDESTVATTIQEITTTWNPDETTEATTFESTVSIQKQAPYPISDEDIPSARETLLVAPAGVIKVTVDNVVLCLFLPQWNIRIIEQATLCTPYKTVLVDCISYRAQVEISVDLFPEGVPGAGHVGEIAVAVCNGFGMMLNPGQFPAPDDLITARIDAAIPGGPNLAAAYSVMADWGADASIPELVGPVVTVGNRLGTVAASSHGYWLTVDSELWPAPPSQSVEFRWKLKLIPSQFINLHDHIRAKILNQLNDGTIQDIVAENPNAQVVVTCDILQLPSTPGNLIPFSQPVFAFGLSPDECGTSCNLLDQSPFGANSGLTPLHEDPPEDSRWDQEDPTIPECPPVPPIG